MKKHYDQFRSWPLIPVIALLMCFANSCFPPPQNEDVSADVQNYVPPQWAPPYDNVSSIRYYYLPDYEMYYDVWSGTFWYMGDGGWVSSVGPPPAYAGIDLSGAFVVLIDRDVDRPWINHTYYRDNYPRHGYDQYKDIVVHNRIVTNVEPGHELVPRAFNENTNRVTFMQRPSGQEPGRTPEPGRAPDPHPTMPPPGGHPQPIQPPAPSQSHSGNYHRVVHEVPMRSIAPSMPAASKNYNYGAGYSKDRAPKKK